MIKWGALPAVLLLCCGCSVHKATLNSYTDPTFKQGEIQRLAIFPIRNTRLAPSEAQELDRKIAQQVNRRDPKIKILGASEAVQILNEKKLAESWAVFLGNYVSSGIPDANALRTFGDALGVDAIMQGEIVGIVSEDGDSWNLKGNTRVTVRYTMLGVKSGKLLWEASSDGIRRNAGTSGEAPPVIEAVTLAIEKILEAVPM